MSSTNAVCPIWGTPALLEAGPDSVVVNSPRAGGKYKIVGSAIAALQNFGIDKKTSLTWWLVEQRRQGNSQPEITTYTLDEVVRLRMPNIVERRDRLLDFIANSSSTITPRIKMAGLMTDKVRAQQEALAAHTASQSNGEVQELIRFAREDHLIDGNENIHLTFKAWTYIEERRARQTASVQCFVAMWFAPEMEGVYEKGFAPAICESGYRPMRIDQKEHINKIDDEIIAEIRRSRFLVADFTSEFNKPRGGVYFEAGFALGLNIPVIWTCREDLVDQLHFDIRQFNQIVWSDPGDLYQKLKNRIGAVLGDGPAGRGA